MYSSTASKSLPAGEKKVNSKLDQATVTTDIDTPLAILQLTPANFHFLTFPKTKHAEHLSDPLGDKPNKSDIEYFSSRVDIHIGL